jgi:hypothetical protein
LTHCFPPILPQWKLPQRVKTDGYPNVKQKVGIIYRAKGREAGILRRIWWNLEQINGRKVYTYDAFFWQLEKLPGAENFISHDCRLSLTCFLPVHPKTANRTTFDEPQCFL